MMPTSLDGNQGDLQFCRDVEDQAMAGLSLPAEIETVFREFRTCEFTTLSRDGTPITWPVLPFYRPREGCFLITTSIGLPQKVFNVRRNPRVSLLFSEPTGSNLQSPPAVLVQGTAEAPDQIGTAVKGLEDELRMVFERQPAAAMYSSNPITRYFFDWYYMRLLIAVVPHRVFYWPDRDFGRIAEKVEVTRVG